MPRRLYLIHTRSTLVVTFVRRNSVFTPARAAYRKVSVRASTGPEKVTMNVPAEKDTAPGELTSKWSTTIWVHPLQKITLTEGMLLSDLTRELSHWTDFLINPPIETPKNKRFIVVAACRVGKQYSKGYMLHEATDYPLHLVKHWAKMQPTEYPKLCDGLAETIIEFVNQFGERLQ